jgi:cyclic pyranopterin phosphate synthase
VADNLGRTPDAFTSAGRSGRVSIYLGTNGATFAPSTIAPDEDFAQALQTMAASLELQELHLTGGEPTLHPRIAELIVLGRRTGYRVCMTSNGENGARAIAASAAAGLDRVNFSIFGTTPKELAQVQATKYANAKRAQAKIAAMRASIQACVDHGVKASANIVVPDESHVSLVTKPALKFLSFRTSAACSWMGRLW